LVHVLSVSFCRFITSYQIKTAMSGKIFVNIWKHRLKADSYFIMIITGKLFYKLSIKCSNSLNKEQWKSNCFLCKIKFFMKFGMYRKKMFHEKNDELCLWQQNFVKNKEVTRKKFPLK
jgi:hypothetical protein